MLYRGVCYHVEMTVGEETPFDFEYALHYAQFIRHEGTWTVQVVRDSRLNGFPGIVEVQLPADYKIKNIEATERAKAKMLEGIHGGGDDAGMEHPHSRQAAFAASRAALRKEDDGGFQKAEASANLKLQRKEFATSFGKGFASKAKKPRH